MRPYKEGKNSMITYLIIAIIIEYWQVFAFPLLMFAVLYGLHINNH